MNHNKNDYPMLTQKKSTTECHSTAILQYSRASPVPLYCRISHLRHALKQKPRLPAPSMAGTGPGCPSEEKMSPSQNTKAEMVSCCWLGESCTRKNVFSYSWAWQQHRVPGRALILCTEPERCQPLLSQNNGIWGWHRIRPWGHSQGCRGWQSQDPAAASAHS